MQLGEDHVVVRRDGDGHRLDDLRRLERLRIMDDDFMRCVFRDRPDLVQGVLRTITGIRDLELTSMETQRDMRRLAGARSLELDVWGTDGDGTQYDMEVQRGDDANPRRARYHGSCMDVEALKRGKDFSELPERWVIFIAEQDVLGGGAATHLFESREAGGSPLCDGAHTPYVNGEYRGDDPIGRLMSDFCQSDPSKIHDRGLAERVRYYKEDPEGVSQMCEIFDQVRNEGIAQGMAQGMAQAIRGLMDSQSVRIETAMDMLGVPASDRDKYERLLVSTKA